MTESVASTNVLSCVRTCPGCGTKAIYQGSNLCQPCSFRRRREAPLTHKQTRILQFILESYAKGWLPTQYEIGAATGSGPTCPKQIQALENKGWLSRRGYRYQLTLKSLEATKVLSDGNNA